APRSSPTRQLSHAAHEVNPLFQPPRSSNSRMSSSKRAGAASRCGELVAETIERRVVDTIGRAIVHGRSPFREATVHLGFRGALRTRAIRIAGRGAVLAEGARGARQ